MGVMDPHLLIREDRSEGWMPEEKDVFIISQAEVWVGRKPPLPTPKSESFGHFQPEGHLAPARTFGDLPSPWSGPSLSEMQVDQGSAI